jgi:DNA polymerase-3 subunit gamma/tau
MILKSACDFFTGAFLYGQGPVFNGILFMDLKGWRYKMAYRALYRVWRPRQFSELKGQEHIAKILLNQVKTGRIAHAYLFCGPRGTGKTSAAKIFSRAVNCESPKDGEPCGSCECCADETSLDIIEIDAASNNGVENIRDLREKVSLLPTSGKYKVYIIDEVHMLSSGAFNALLKTLEEPPAHVIFILATTEPRKLPATILSRCQRFDFRRISANEMAERLNEIAECEKFFADDKALMMIAHASDGAMRDAISLMDQASGMEGGVTTANVSELLGGTDRQSLFALAGYTANYDIKNSLLLFDALKNGGCDLGLLQKDITGLLRDMLVLAFLGGDEGLTHYYEDPAALKAMGNQMGRHALTRALEIFIRAEQDMRYHSQPDIVLQSALIRAMTPEDGGQNTDTAARLNKLESSLEKLRAEGIKIQAAIKDDPSHVQMKQETRAPSEKPVKKAEPKIPLNANTQEQWKMLLDAIQKKARYLLEPASMMELTEVTEESLRFCCKEKDAAAADLLCTERARQVLSAAAADIFGREMVCRITIEKEKESETDWAEEFGPGIEII